METATHHRDATISSVILRYIRGNIRSSDSACSCNLAEYTECPRLDVLPTTDTTDQTRKQWSRQFREISSDRIMLNWNMDLQRKFF